MRLLLACLFLPILSPAQNLVPNPGFEENRSKKVLFWQQPHGNYYHYTQESEEHGKAVNGKFFNGICVVNRIASEYLEIKLTRPLVKGERYKLGFYMRLDTSSMHNFKKIRTMDVLFSSKPIQVDTRVKLKTPPHLTLAFDTTSITSWTYMETDYTAGGGEHYMIIGKFFQDADSIQKFLDSAKNDLAFAKKRIITEQKNVLQEYQKKHPSRHPVHKKKKGTKSGAGMDYNEYKKFLKAYDKEVKDIKSDFKQKLQHNIDSIKKKYHVDDYYYDSRFFFDDFSLVCLNCDVLSGNTGPVPGQSYTLYNIHFESNKYELLDGASAELDKLANFLVQNPKIKIQVSGHTDNTGDPEENLVLSHNRAKTVIEYMVNKGIDKKRLSAKGYGSSKPRANNSTEEGRQQNRRVEFTVVE